MITIKERMAILEDLECSAKDLAHSCPTLNQSVMQAQIIIAICLLEESISKDRYGEEQGHCDD